MAQRLYVGTRKGLFELTRAGPGWRISGTHFLGEPVTAVLPDARGGRLYAALSLGHFGPKLHASDDAGRSWSALAVPEYPPQPEGATGPAWSLQSIWCLEAGARGRPGELWAGTLPGGLFRSPDGGASWQLVESLWNRPERLEWFGGGNDVPGIHSVCVDPARPERITVAVSCGGVWQTVDGAGSWSLAAAGMRAAYLPPERAGDPNVQDPHRMVQCRARPECFWVQHHNGIFRSTDGARRWQEVAAPGLSPFGFAVAVHPRDPQTAWFVPAVKDECRVAVDGALAVTRTADGGESFEVLRAGLPQRHAYDLVFRHALDVSEDGDGLAMGSTTGGLWTSADQGAHWRGMGARLPPVYCVRFAQA